MSFLFGIAVGSMIAVLYLEHVISVLQKMIPDMPFL